ncbi:MAG: hypothetical protein IJ570_03800 [Prevotella sp.]|nr:hypothetical protein [Prevotella sp.]
MLLAVFVPMLLLASLHVHEQGAAAADSCVECVEHHCGGHFGQQTLSMHPCVLCQFLSLPVVLAAMVLLAVLLLVQSVSIASCGAFFPVAVADRHIPRAPPASF